MVMPKWVITGKNTLQYHESLMVQMKKVNQYLLTIAGFDPTGGAGILADIKTFEQNKCVGMAVQTANTVQTENTFTAVNWVDDAIIFNQLNSLLKQYQFNFVKIGLIKDLVLLEKIVDRCLEANPDTKIIWDPVLKASAGFDFNHDLSILNQILPKLYLITPNWNEIKSLTGNEDAMSAAKTLSQYVKVLLKGGHNLTAPGKDYWLDNSSIKTFNPKPARFHEKHGSGCVLSAAVLANLSKGYSVQKSVLRSKRYIEGFLSSHPSLIGKHKL